MCPVCMHESNGTRRKQYAGSETTLKKNVSLKVSTATKQSANTNVTAMHDDLSENRQKQLGKREVLDK